MTDAVLQDAKRVVREFHDALDAAAHDEVERVLTAHTTDDWVVARDAPVL